MPQGSQIKEADAENAKSIFTDAVCSLNKRNKSPGAALAVIIKGHCVI